MRSRSSIRSSCCDVTSSEISPSETNWIPTTMSRTPRVRSGRVPMPVSPELQITVRYVEDDEAHCAHEHPDPAEEVQRPVPVAAHERHAEQVEEAAEVALRPVPRAADAGATVVHRDLGDAKAAICGEHRDEAMELAVQAHPLQNLRAIRLQPAVDVVESTPETLPVIQLKTREKRRLTYGSFLRVFQPETRSKPSSSFASILGISDGSSCRSASMVTTISPRASRNPACSAAALPKFRRRWMTTTLGHLVVQARENGHAPVGGAVVDEHDFELVAPRLERVGDLRVQRLE